MRKVVVGFGGLTLWFMEIRVTIVKERMFVRNDGCWVTLTCLGKTNCINNFRISNDVIQVCVDIDR